MKNHERLNIIEAREYPDEWFTHLIDLNNRLTRIDPDYTLFQLKAKFGELRFYYSTTTQRNDEMDAHVYMTERICRKASESRKIFDRVAAPAPEWDASTTRQW